ncbi:protein TonB [Altererythrobacter atlanticus]|uniref:hypothetical protein n=1 Tax=Croceibacterium atlanticum TaxID=1267766 RepID=UPI0017D0BC96|nr:hypothetical protein [Croceibacterium atlanticum]MBB5732553.1 protein TonB [Croceibacterium atlanticum]
MPEGSLRERIRAGLGPRAMGIIVALALEALLIGLLLTIGWVNSPPEVMGPAIATFDAGDAEPDQAPEPQPETEQEQSVQEQVREAEPTETPPEPVLEPVLEPRPAPSIPAFIPLTRDQMASADIATRESAPAPPAASQPAYGPADMEPGPPDTERVGTAPNGEPLYAARWYREPTRDEMAGYLSTARPGWGLIACKTAPNYRVEDCVALEESPRGSNVARAALAAAWQFRVRPPRLGGKEMIGEWVRIRIDYRITR